MPTEFTAQVIAAHGRHLEVRAADGSMHAARPFGRRLTVVCGDRVRCRLDERHGEVHVLEVLPRRTELQRANVRGESELVVANVDVLAIVLAPRPPPDFFVVDRYVAAAESSRIAAIIVSNKQDLEADATHGAELEAYRRIGYEIVPCSAKREQGIEALRATLAGRTASLVGQSGVGKSSIVKALVPEAAVVTGELARAETGRHTTSASRLYDLPGSGHLIDSPGVRDFAPAIERLEPRSLGFVEIARQAEGCRFADCRHMQEPRCAVREAAESGAVPARRYESYRRLRRLYEELKASLGPGRS